MEFCSGSVSLFHKRRHATTAALRSTPGTIILNSAHILFPGHGSEMLAGPRSRSQAGSDAGPAPGISVV